MLDVLSLYQIYLIVVVIAAVWLRFASWRDLLVFAKKFPTRWPKMLKTILKERWALLTWSTLAPLIVAILAAATHTFFNQFWWSEAELPVGTLFQYPAFLLLLLPLAMAMLYFDFQALTKSSSVSTEELEKQLDRGELAMSKPVHWGVRLMTFGFVNTNEIVEHEVAESLEKQTVVIEQQMKGWLGRSAVRIAFGISCWFAWAYIQAAAA